MSLAPEDRWIWDPFLVEEGGLWHAFFAQAPRVPGGARGRAARASIGRAEGPDLRGWRDLSPLEAPCLAPAEGPAWDDLALGAGSVVRGPDGLWHMFYTGTCRAEEGLIPRVGRAVSEDLRAWRRAGAGPCLDLAAAPEGAGYEAFPAGIWDTQILGDPHVYADPAGGWLMAFSARAAGAAVPAEGGAIGLAESDDLATWRLLPPMHAGGFARIGRPQPFEMEGRWRCLISVRARDWSAPLARGAEGGPVSGVHWLDGEGPRGPWRLAPPPLLDGAQPPRQMGGRIALAAGGPLLIGHAVTASGAFAGALTDPTPLALGPGGALRVRGSRE